MKINRSNIISWLKLLIGWPLSIISILFIVKFVADKSSELTISLSDINYPILAVGIIFFFIYYLLRSFLWRSLITESGEKIEFRENTYKFAFSELKRFTPGNIWSFLSRGTLFAEAGITKRTVGISILADIQLVILGCTITSVFAIPWIISTKELASHLSALLPISLILIVIYFFVTASIFKKKYDKDASIFSSLWLPGFRLNSKLKVLILAVITYFIYGIGNYFVLISLFNVGFTSFFVVSSFFVFALLVGYLSFITPMGLGIRELVVSLGLANVLSPADAGAVSIFTRIVLVVSELSFLALVFLWEKSAKSK